MQDHRPNTDAPKAESHIQKPLLQAMDKAIKATRKRIAKIQASLARPDAARTLRAMGEILKANYHLLQPGMTEVTLQDFSHETPSAVTIALDPGKSVEDNCALYFRKARKCKDARLHAGQRLRESEKLLSTLCRMQRALHERPATANTVCARLQHLGFTRFLQTMDRHTAHKIAGDRARYRLFHSRDGFPILVGKSARDNHYVTFRKGSGCDLWCHLAHESGSHVVVKLPKGVKPPHATLLDAATLAVYYSRRRGARQAEVIHSRVCDVRKAKGSAHGKVWVPFGKHLHITLDQDRLQRLLHTGAGASSVCSPSG